MWISAALAIVICVDAFGGSLQGRVINSVTGGGIAGVKIDLCRPAPGTPFCTKPAFGTTSGENGVFRIPDLPDAQYELTPFLEAFASSDPKFAVRVFGDSRFDFQMTPPANIAGRVTDADGNPAPGTTMKLDLFGCWTCGGIDEKTTGENGEFLFEGELAGTYAISATPKNKPGAKDELAVVTTYYPSVIEREQASVIRLQGSDLSGYNIRLQTARARRIRGVVIDADGKPAAHARVSVYQPSSGMITALHGFWAPLWPAPLPVVEPVETMADGSFIFPPILEGEWTISAVMEGDRNDFRSGSARVTLGRSELTGLEIHLAPPFLVEMAADWGETPPPTLPRLLPYFNALEGQPFAIPDVKAGQLPALKLSPGRYFVWPGPGNFLPGYYLARAILNDRDVLGQVVDLAGPTTVKLIYKTGGGSVHGTIDRCGGATIVLLGDPGPSSRLGYSGRCDPGGSYLIRDVPPGEYTIAAFPGVPKVLSDVLTVLAGSGKRVRIDAGSQASADLRVAPQP